MSFLIVGTNGNFSTQFQNIAKNHISHSINRNMYINWDKKQVQCKLDNISIAYLTGNIETWLEKCVK